MSKTLVYIDILAILLLLFAGTDKVVSWNILSEIGLVLVIFVSGTLLLITTFLRLTTKEE